MGKAIRKGDEIVLTLSTNEAEWAAACLLEAGFPLDVETRDTFAQLNAALTPPKPASPRTYTCATPGCYKFGHAFTDKGWNGDPAKGIKGHVQISSAHRA